MSASPCTPFIQLGHLLSKGVHFLLTPVKNLLHPLFLQHERYHVCHLFQRWRLPPRFCRHLVSNLYVGLAILFLVLLCHNLPLFTTIENVAMDWVIYIQRNTILTNPVTPHFVFLDIDEATYRKWGEPRFTPRDQLQKLIEFAVAGQPQVLIVDVDLSYPSNHFPPQISELTEADKNLKQYLTDYEKNQCQNGSCPHLILVRNSRVPLDNKGTLDFTKPREPLPFFGEADSELEKVIEQSPHLHQASPIFELEDNHIIRRWQQCQRKFKGDTASYSASVQLLVKLLLANPSEPPLTHTPLTEKICQQCNHADSSSSHSELERRILYKFTQTDTAGPYPKTDQGQDILNTLSAQLIINKPDQVDKAVLNQSITIIGGSYHSGRDSYITPLEIMPGAVVILNAIHSLLQYNEVRKLGMITIIAIEIILLLLMTVAFTCLKSFWAMLLSGMAIIVIMIPVSFYLSEHGIWLDFAIPLLSVQLHRMAADLHHS